MSKFTLISTNAKIFTASAQLMRHSIICTSRKNFNAICPPPKSFSSLYIGKSFKLIRAPLALEKPLVVFSVQSWYYWDPGETRNVGVSISNPNPYQKGTTLEYKACIDGVELPYLEGSQEVLVPGGGMLEVIITASAPSQFGAYFKLFARVEGTALWTASPVFTTAIIEMPPNPTPR